MDNSKNLFYMKEINLIEMQLRCIVVYILYLRVPTAYKLYGHIIFY